MTSNFDFLCETYPDLHNHAVQAENLIKTAPRASCFYSRYTLEQTVQWLYKNDPYLRPPYDNKLGALIHEQTFKDNLSPGLFPKFRTILKTGNHAVHQNIPIAEKDALHLVQELFHILYWLCRFYSPNGRNLPSLRFNPDLIPESQNTGDYTRQQLQDLENQLSKSDEMRRIAEEKKQQTEEQLNILKAELDALRQQNEAVKDTHDYNEADTRRYLIDLLLREAGWDISDPHAVEYEVIGMPNSSGKGYIDYVLWGNDGKPLALVEAKRTRKDATQGKHQAKLYADCLEQQYNQRPVIFYSNGYQHWLWDDVSYPPRSVQGFLKPDELQRIIFRRSNRKALHLVHTNTDIAGRTYQLEAIRRITEEFQQHKKRKTLLVMATGTGKTRTAIALVDLLKRANWVNRVLFLADRNALLTQAKRAFKTHLPTLTPIDLTQDKAIETANVVLSTYPTIFNAINRNDSNTRFISPGHFDLVIVDEAHRSIYQKYRFLFEYFDSLLVGLTATPRNEIHRDTYQVFDLEPGVPSFAYELSDAISDGYLVPPHGVNVPFRFLRQGINYDHLSPEEQEEYEATFFDDTTEDLPPAIEPAALNNWLFNLNTIDQALELLMEKGLRVEGGDRLGKTIIFARNHDHANLIVQRFDKNYPHLKGAFAQVIDSHNAYAQSLLDEFSEPHKDPTIAVSVDMLDTGVDIPEVVNLVFFKPVYSRVKFNQMIGRGTRRCPDLFGLGEDKQAFLVFDLCGNFDFFNQEITERDRKPPESLSTRLVKTRLQLAHNLDSHANDEETKELKANLLDHLHQHVATMERDNFLVRRHLEAVETFSQRERWEDLSEDDLETITDNLASLPNGLPRDKELPKRFDLLCLKLQLAILKQDNTFTKYRDKIRDFVTQLEAKSNIPMIKEQLPLIEEVKAESWWEDVTPWMVEYVRQNLRELTQFIDKEQRDVVYTNFTDELGEIEETDVPIEQTGFSPYQYRKKVEAYIKANENHIAIARLKRNFPLTESDLTALEEMLFTAEAIESRERFEEAFGKQPSLPYFIRQLVGLDRNAAKEAFSQYLTPETFNANQIRFVETIIDYLTQNGVMDPGLLYEPPFQDFHYEGLDGVFPEAEADQIIEIVRSFNETVSADFDVA